MPRSPAITPVAAPKLAFLFIGGPHQVFHLAPVAVELSRLLPAARIECVYPDEATGDALRQVCASLDCSSLVIRRVAVPRWADWVARMSHRHAVTKLPLLLKLARELDDSAAVVTPERTSAFLRWFGVHHPLLIHFRHGAGDRAPKSETRLKAFDLVVVPGDKDLKRAIEVQRLAPARLRESGYIKLDYLARLAGSPPRLFADDRPTVIYNPHFDAARSSWPQARVVVAMFATQDRYNLVVAPHIRLSQDMTTAERSEWRALAVPDRIIVDLNSPRLLDMTYIRGADVYLGDVSSQLYEFLSTPRPVAFLNTHGVAWADDPRYAGWHLGEVANHPDDVLAAIDRARGNHARKIERQRAAVAAAFGNYIGASGRGAAIVAEAAGLAPVATAMLT